MTTAVCPGSFDPVTNGHLDIIGRASNLFDDVVVAVLYNESKAGFFQVGQRLQLLQEAVSDLPNVRIDSFQGLLVDYCADNNISAIVKGLRAVSDFDYELQMAQMNRSLTDVDTVFIPTSHTYSFLASSLIKEVARGGGDVREFVPAHVARALYERLSQTS